MADEHKNFYEILHVQQDAPSEVIRATYRTMMQKMKMHPDLGGDESNAALINEAYAVLMDPAAREKYDKTLTAAPENAQQANSNQANTGNVASNVAPPVRAPVRKILSPNICPFCDLPHQMANRITPDSVCSRCESALYPADKQAFGQSGNRIIQRIEKQWPVSYFVQWPITRGYMGTTQDVSLNGIQMQSHQSLRRGQIVKLTSQMLDAVAMVVNVREDHALLRKRWRVGLEFITLRFHHSQGTFVKIDA